MKTLDPPRDLIPIYLDSEKGTETFVWPADGNAKVAAERLFKGQGSSKDASYQVTLRQLESLSETFKDTIYRVPGSRLTVIQYIVKVEEEPPVIFADHIKWDINTPDAMIGVYASRVARDCGLSHKAAIRIDAELRKLVSRARETMKTNPKQIIRRLDAEEMVRQKAHSFPKVIRGAQARALIERSARGAAAGGSKPQGEGSSTGADVKKEEALNSPTGTT